MSNENQKGVKMTPSVLLVLNTHFKTPKACISLSELVSDGWIKRPIISDMGQIGTGVGLQKAYNARGFYQSHKSRVMKLV